MPGQQAKMGSKMDQPSEGLKALDNFLIKTRNIRFVRLLWLDYVSTLRARVLVITHFRELIASGRFHEVGPCFVCLPDDSGPWYENDPAAAVGKLSLIPDLESLKPVPGYEHHASVFCYLGDSCASNTDRPSVMGLTLSPLCPRSILLAAVTKAEDLGVTVLVGIEIEFTVLKTDDNGTSRALDYPAHQASSIRTLEIGMVPIFDEIIDALTYAGVSVQHYQSEGAQSQFEMALSPLPPMQAADAFLIARECIRSTFRRHGLVATLHPSCGPFGSGLHIHISADGTRCKTQSDHKSFLAGILSHLPGLCALGMTTPMSFARQKPSICGSGQWVAWGTQNRQTAVRAIEQNHWELKAIDGLSCIYLVVAGYVRCGLEGLDSLSTLREADCLVDPAFLSDEERNALQINVRLPDSVSNAVAALKKDKFLIGILGPELIESYWLCIEAYDEFLRKVEERDGYDAQFQHVVQRI
ncbi:hypothetical protein O1611_g63 [Lasiodiplodia mahajangana]|uniref:Uncharacterized protein n=1 Tax=Lasiodiplodia mahajangana TaxID=1108764 RepID=A0ACC2K1V3_9PEZI|nr:hypothetical protein O1611_g63 [Lasiodiplodia mahajangana]